MDDNSEVSLDASIVFGGRDSVLGNGITAGTVLYGTEFALMRCDDILIDVDGSLL
jgi:hypothetical protein